jgi:hypothetical protein
MSILAEMSLIAKSFGDDNVYLSFTHLHYSVMTNSVTNDGSECATLMRERDLCHFPFSLRFGNFEIKLTALVY